MQKQKGPHRVIGLLGVKGSGKDTAAQFLVQERGFIRIGFADALYAEAADAFGVSVEFLGHRDTKETPLAELALGRCRDPVYVACVARQFSPGGLLSPVQLAEPRSPRFILQNWGTEYRRRGAQGIYLGQDSYWLDIVSTAIATNPQGRFVVPDVRFLNEFNLVRNLEGVLGRICRPEVETQEALARLKSGTSAHPSETELLGIAVDCELLNQEGAPGALREAILGMAG